MKNIRLLPAFVTLLAGAITSITLYIFGFDTFTMMLILLAVLIVFYVLGVIAMKIIMDCSVKEKKEEMEETQEVQAQDDAKKEEK